MKSLAAALNAAVTAEPAFRHLQSVIVVVRGEAVVEQYFRDRRSGDLSNLHSVTKSVVASLVGIAIADGSLALTTRVADVLDVPPATQDSRKREITVEHILTMTSGLDADSPYDIDEIADRGESWVAGPLAAPLRADPGTMFGYNNGAVHVLGAVIANATGTPLARFAEERLFTPLGIEHYRWPTDPDGNRLAYGHLELRPRDLAQLGSLYLGHGSFRDAQLLDPAFVDAATTPASGGGGPEGQPYGYLWWISDDGSYFAGGYAGQYLTVVPALELVVVTTGDAAVFIETSRNTRQLVTEVVVPALVTGYEQ